MYRISDTGIRIYIFAIVNLCHIPFQNIADVKKLTQSESLELNPFTTFRFSRSDFIGYWKNTDCVAKTQ